jgi:hypothetical protein
VDDEIIPVADIRTTVKAYCKALDSPTWRDLKADTGDQGAVVQYIEDDTAKRIHSVSARGRSPIYLSFSARPPHPSLRRLSSAGLPTVSTALPSRAAPRRSSATSTLKPTNSACVRLRPQNLLTVLDGRMLRLPIWRPSSPACKRRINPPDLLWAPPRPALLAACRLNRPTTATPPARTLPRLPLRPSCPLWL